VSIPTRITLVGLAVAIVVLAVAELDASRVYRPDRVIAVRAPAGFLLKTVAIGIRTSARIAALAVSLTHPAVGAVGSSATGLAVAAARPAGQARHTDFSGAACRA